MFSRFNLKLENDMDSYIDIGEIEDNNKNNEEYINNVLEKYILDDGSIDGDGLQDEWFPDIKADIFISYSHNDDDKAKKLAAWLKKSLD